MSETKVTSIRLNEDYKEMIEDIKKRKFDQYGNNEITDTDIIKYCIRYTFFNS